MADIDAALVEQIFHIAKGQRKPDIEHRRQADNLAARFEIAKGIMFGHPTTLRNHSTHLKLVWSDSTTHLEASGLRATLVNSPSCHGTAAPFAAWATRFSETVCCEIDTAPYYFDPNYTEI